MPAIERNGIREQPGNDPRLTTVARHAVTSVMLRATASGPNTSPGSTCAMSVRNAPKPQPAMTASFRPLFPTGCSTRCAPRARCRPSRGRSRRSAWLSAGRRSRLANTTGSVAVTTAAVGATVAALPIARPRYKQARPTAPTSPADAAQPELASDGGARPSPTPGPAQQHDARERRQRQDLELSAASRRDAARKIAGPPDDRRGQRERMPTASRRASLAAGDVDEAPVVYDASSDSSHRIAAPLPRLAAALHRHERLDAIDAIRLAAARVDARCR